MPYYSYESFTGTDFVCIVKDHAKRVTSKLLVRAENEMAARLAFRGERSFSLVSIRPAAA